VQSGSDADITSLLFEKRPPITVDESGGLFLLSVTRPRAHILASGNDRVPSTAPHSPIAGPSRSSTVPRFVHQLARVPCTERSMSGNAPRLRTSRPLPRKRDEQCSLVVYRLSFIGCANFSLSPPPRRHNIRKWVRHLVYTDHSGPFGVWPLRPVGLPEAFRRNSECSRPCGDKVAKPDVRTGQSYHGSPFIN